MYVENIVNLAHGAQQAATSAEHREVPNEAANWRKDNKTQQSNRYIYRRFVLYDDLTTVCSNQQTVAQIIMRATTRLEQLNGQLSNL